MDIALLTSFLIPFLPFLMKFGEKASEKAGEEFGEGAWIKAKGIWSKLHPKLEAKDDARVAAEQVATKPGSEVRRAFFQEELDTLLKDNPDLAKEIARILQEDAPDGTPGNQVIQNVTGSQNQVFNISGTTITNLTGAGDIHYQEAPHQSTIPAKDVEDIK